MGYTKVLLLPMLCVLALFVSTRLASGHKIPICGDYKCPHFRKLNESWYKQDFEERRYDHGSVYAMTSSSWKLYVSLFSPLFDYIQGNNVHGEKYDMTVPVKTFKAEGMRHMMFYLGKGNYSEPKDHHVKLVYLAKDQIVFVRPYKTRWMFMAIWHCYKLWHSLDSHGMRFMDSCMHMTYEQPGFLRMAYEEVAYFLDKPVLKPHAPKKWHNMP
ncbi:hypothetical protein Ahia01_001325100 [Argonauta hians]